MKCPTGKGKSYGGERSMIHPARTVIAQFESGMHILRVIHERDARATSQTKLLTINGAARYKRIPSSMEVKDADDQDPDH